MSVTECPECKNPLKGFKCEMCGYSSIPEWIRLRHDSGIAITISEDLTNFNREIIHTYFRSIISPVGNPIAAYFPSDGSPLFIVTKEESGWCASSAAIHRNKALLDGKELRTDPQIINDGTRLDIIAGHDGSVVETFTFYYK
jgi:hypothetical protein